MSPLIPQSKGWRFSTGALASQLRGSGTQSRPEAHGACRMQTPHHHCLRQKHHLKPGTTAVGAPGGVSQKGQGFSAEQEDG